MNSFFPRSLIFQLQTWTQSRRYREKRLRLIQIRIERERLSEDARPIVKANRARQFVVRRYSAQLVHTPPGRSLSELRRFHVAMLFEELVEQHRVHRFVAHTVDLPIGIASDRVGRFLICEMRYFRLAS